MLTAVVILLNIYQQVQVVILLCVCVSPCLSLWTISTGASSFRQTAADQQRWYGG